MLQELDLFEQDPSEVDETDLGIVLTQAVVTSTDWTTETVLSQLKRGNIELSPRFQRREAWDNNRKSRFIESLFWVYLFPKLCWQNAKTREGHTSSSTASNAYCPFGDLGLKTVSMMNRKSFSH